MDRDSDLERTLSFVYNGKRIPISIDDVPAKVIETGIPFEIDNFKLWKSPAKEADLPTQSFEWLLDIPLWAYKDKPFQVSPATVLALPNHYSEHFNNIVNANLAYPIEVTYFKENYLILDGLHRFSNAHSKGFKTIRVRLHEYTDLLKCIDVESTAPSILRQLRKSHQIDF